MIITADVNTEHRTCAGNLLIKIIFIINAIDALYENADTRKSMETKGKQTQTTYDLNFQESTTASFLLPFFQSLCIFSYSYEVCLHLKFKYYFKKRFIIEFPSMQKAERTPMRPAPQFRQLVSRGRYFI